MKLSRSTSFRQRGGCEILQGKWWGRLAGNLAFHDCIHAGPQQSQAAREVVVYIVYGSVEWTKAGHRTREQMSKN